MVHVFVEATKTFEQVHYKKVEQRHAKKVQKRHKNSEYNKLLLTLEQQYPVKCIYTEKKPE